MSVCSVCACVCMSDNSVCYVCVKPKLLDFKTELFSLSSAFFLYRWQMHLMFMCVLGCYVASTVVLVPKPFRGC